MRFSSLLAGAALAVAGTASAQGIATSLGVEAIRVDSDGKALVRFSANLSGSRPGCMDGGYANYLAFDANTAGGKNILAVLLSAKLGERTVTAYGTGTCPTYGLIENWFFGSIE